MKRLVVFCIAGMCLLGCSSRQEVFSLGVDTLPRDRNSDPWVLDQQPAVYGPDNLYEYLDGQAVFYLDYGMIRCVHARYHHYTNQQRRLTVDLFEMPDDLSAFGVLSAGRASHAEPVELASGGYWQDGQLCWARSYVHARVVASSADLQGMTDASLMAAMVDRRLNLPATRPAQLDVLPVRLMVPGSGRLIAKNMLGHSFLGKGWMARYDANTDANKTSLQFDLFWIPCDSVEQASDRLAELRRFGTENGQVSELRDRAERVMTLIKGKYTGTLLVRQSGRDIAGTVDCPDHRIGADLIDQTLVRAAQSRR